MSNKAWGGRFQSEPEAWVDAFNASINFDHLLIDEDIQGSIAHATMLAQQGILTEDESNTIIKGLQEIQQDYHDGKIEFTEALEDIHLNIEHELIERIGAVGGKLHTGRSRNDQVATDLHLYTKKAVKEIIHLIHTLQETIVKLADDHVDTIMPGYTHLQRAQPISFAHHVMTYFWMLERDKNRFEDALKRIDINPLGAAALSGTTHPIDRAKTQELLDFAALYENSLDAVSDRDFVVETLNDISLVMIHLSRFSEEIIFWSSDEAKFITLSDSFSTGSSIMPQKKNPDMAELIRGKTGRTTGHLMSMLMTLKGLPLAYNKDMQEDKEGLFDAVHTVTGSLRIFEGMLASLTVNTDRLNETVHQDFSNATELADYLVEKDVPFREAHAIVGQIVYWCIQHDCYLLDVPLEKYQEFSSSIDDTIYSYLKPENCLKRRKSYGSTGQESVRHQIKVAKDLL
ncbi:argininosuccinate lyase [Staphylococcus carnosus]|uniref:Argininosuccinate lyase n=2 Tax=Staphylococcus carnosus TaxID=1281 RepID=ARLY_STACT|nr:argininosuccinate lyase [Staphylococcus carnosus]B9DIU3.1 RecName: Full=Argininosuccinate lyase; Short=ASAL; AltName: Full=Arginosuccinase [Staphylococcus carnosus subsp. carnosus TM300]ANZ33817.1 argininosuccinate lyase [Staphylococcus carnosus]KKB24813.1 argininosuccinate lyase [Staphylococcus carnosus]POA03293.1 argininosuccinate lyase [Staphylococcus carnosus]QPT03659.1 argininosuccinate lyase [Staphylococcus carnosus]QQS85758.1 argininosuccinate lyase [Staphylococcus carnosus]